MRRFALIAIFAIIPLGLSAARLTLRDGSVVYGRFVSGSSQEIVFQDDQGIRRRFDINRVQNLDFSGSGAPAGAYQNNQSDRYNNNSANRSDDRYNNNTGYRGQDYGYGNAYATVPAGTELSVRANEEITAQTAAEGRTYSATIDRDVFDESGRVVIPRGSDAEMVVRTVNQGGTFSGGNLVLDLQAVRVNGRRYLISTNDIQQGNGQGIGKNQRTGELVGGGAALGTLIGAIAGGGKGALLGAIAGAIGGGTVQVLTKGREIRVPAETELHFRLDQPLQLREMR
jgi:hypothetical protein